MWNLDLSQHKSAKHDTLLVYVYIYNIHTFMHTILYNYIIVQYCSYNMGLHTLHIDRSQMPMDSMVSPARWGLWTGACWELWRARSTRIISCGSSQADRLRIDPKKPVTENGTSTIRDVFWRDIHDGTFMGPCDFCQAICFGMSNFRARIKTRDLLLRCP